MSIEKRTIDGLNYILDMDSDLDRDLFEHGVFESHLQEAARKVLPEDGVVFDIGANVGLLTLPLAKMVPNGKVFAFEPDTACYSALSANVDENISLMDRIGIYSFVMQHDANGVVPFYIRRTGGNRGISSSVNLNKHVREQIPRCTMTVDEFSSVMELKRVDLLKIDVEGAESKVLQGAAKTIDKYKPAIIWECSVILDEMSGTNNTFDSFTFLASAGYKQTIINRDGTFTLLTEWRPNLNYADILAVHKTKVSNVR